MLAVLWSLHHAYDAAWIWQKMSTNMALRLGSLNGVKLMAFAKMRVDLMV